MQRGAYAAVINGMGLMTSNANNRRTASIKQDASNVLIEHVPMGGGRNTDAYNAMYNNA